MQLGSSRSGRHASLKKQVRPRLDRVAARRKRVLMEALEERTLLSGLIPVPTHRDLVFDHTRNLLYITTSTGTLERYDVSTGTLLAPWSVGASLNGADITPDGSTLLVAENAAAGGNAVLHKVNLSTGAVNDLSFPVTGSETGVYDVAVVSNTKAFLTTRAAAPVFVPLRQLDLTSNTFTTRTDARGTGTGGLVQERTQITRSPDRDFLLFTEANTSTGRMFRYRTSTDTFPAQFNRGSALTDSLASVNRTGTFVALESGVGFTGLSIHNTTSLGSTESIGGTIGGVQYDPVRDLLYLVNASQDLIQVYLSGTGIVHSLSIKEDVFASVAMGSGVMTVTPDGQWLFLATPMGVRQYGISDSPLPDAGGPYTVAEGGSLTLNGTAESNRGSNVARFEWDLNYDGVTFDIDRTGANVFVTASGIDGPVQRVVALRVVGTDGSTRIDTAMLTINNSGPGLSLQLPGAWEAGSALPLDYFALDEGGDSFELAVDWGDGTSQTFQQGQSLSHVYQNPGQYEIEVTATDDEGGSTVRSHEAQIHPSTLHPGFGNDGRAITDVGAGSEAPGDLLALPDGDLLAVGRADASGGSIALVRYNPDGSLDMAFGVSGVALTSLGMTRVEDAHLLPDGKVLVAGSRIDPFSGDERFLVARFEADGDPDPTFGAGGWVETDFNTTADRAHALAIAPDGKIVVLGNAYNPGADRYQSAIARYDANGGPDLSFGTGGKLLLTAGPFGTNRSAALAIYPDGKILIGGYTETGFGLGSLLARFDVDGQLDPSYGNGGLIIRDDNSGADIEITALALYPDGRLLEAGSFNHIPYTERKLANGNTDFTYNPLGYGGADDVVEPVHSIQLLPAGKILFVGERGISRADSSGDADLSFGNDGVSRPPFSGGRTTGVAVLADGSVALAAEIDSGGATTGWGVAHIPAEAPLASAGGPYFVPENGSIQLQGHVRSDRAGSGDIIDYEWDFNYDGITFDIDAAVPQPTFSAAGLDNPLTRTIALRVRDSMGMTSLSTTTVNIVNVAPALVLSGFLSVHEGETYTLGLASMDPGVDTITSWTINWGDGSVETFMGNPASVTHVYTGSFIRSITATATDDDGTHAASNSLKISVLGPDQPPLIQSLELSSPTINEGSTVTLSGALTSDGDPHTITIYWRDGTSSTLNLASGVTDFAAMHQYKDNVPAGPPPSALFDIRIEATDGTNTDFDSIDLTVNNVAPIVSVGPDREVPEGGGTIVSASVTEPNGVTDTHTYSWVVRDASNNIVAMETTPILSFDWPDEGVFTATVTVTDDDGGMASDSMVITFTNTPPTLTLSGAATASHLTPYTLNLSSFDPGPEIISSWTINWGDGAVETFMGNPSQVTHQYSGKAIRTITATATDEDGTHPASNSLNVTVTGPNEAPTITLLSLSATTIDEGASVTLNGTFAADGDAHTVRIFWKDGSQTLLNRPAGATTFSSSHQFKDNRPIDYPWNSDFTILVEVSDGEFTTSQVINLTVNNVAPFASAGPDRSAIEGQNFTQSGTRIEPAGVVDTHTWSWTVTDEIGNVVLTGGAQLLSAAFTDNGTYTATLTVTDDDRGVGTDTAVFTVANVAPTLTITAPASVTETQFFRIELAAFDPGNDRIQKWTIDFDDENPPLEINTSTIFPIDYFYTDGPGTRLITVSIQDEDGTYTFPARSLEVTNIAPTVGISGPDSVVAESPYTLSLSSSDPGPDTITEWIINWGDGNPLETVVGDPDFATHTYHSPGAYVIHASATDEDGTYSAGSRSITVGAGPPSLSGGVLTIGGSVISADTVTVRRGTGAAANDLIVVLNGSTYTYPYASVMQVNLDTYGGNDTVTFGQAPPATVNLGDGDDTFFAASSSAFPASTNPIVVSGGAGNDHADIGGDTPIVPGALVQFRGDAGTADRITYRGSINIDTILLTLGEYSGGSARVEPQTGVESVMVLAGGNNDSITIDIGPADLGPQDYQLWGEAGSDTIMLASGNDDITADGGAGNDSIAVLPDAGVTSAWIYGGTGTDTLTFQSRSTDDTIQVDSTKISDGSKSILYSSNSTLESTIVEGRDGNDTFNVSNFHFLGSLTLRGDGGADTFNVTSGTNRPLTIEGGDGNDIFNFNAPTPGVNVPPPTSALSFLGNAGSNTINLNATSLVFTQDLQLTSGHVSINANVNSRVTFQASQRLGALTLASAARVTLTAGGSKTIFCTDLSIAAGGLLELNDGDLAIETSSQAMLDAISEWIRIARNGGAWNGSTGIMSTSAKNNLAKTTGLGFRPYPAESGPFTENPYILVKYTWVADADTDGRVTSDDFKITDKGFLVGGDMFFKGDLNFDGIVNLDDYILLDLGYLNQTLVL